MQILLTVVNLLLIDVLPLSVDSLINLIGHETRWEWEWKVTEDQVALRKTELEQSSTAI